MIQRNYFYRQTNGKKARSLAASQIVSKDGYRVELPATCFTARGLMKPVVLKDVVGHWDKDKVEQLVAKHHAVLLAETA
jgi:hypothetical protein